ncbi:MAG: hypothetical protein ACP5TY_11920 [Thermodesulforhabdaceae bacterium]|jgi:hypothetical protein
MVKEGDVVLVYVENQPAFFARVESITPDVKPEWFQVKMLVLQIPMIVVTWILREAYINGTEFTMGGRPIKIVPVVAPPDLWDESEETIENSEAGEKTGKASESKKTKGTSDISTGSKVISLSDRKKSKE